ncbi:MAG: hypothetical protein CSA26_07415 [Desulfobacterales bacterium]|nr:MAG: hypothetical protein CSA26_07415 [Desulfobacterales bacterium]
MFSKLAETNILLSRTTILAATTLFLCLLELAFLAVLLFAIRSDLRRHIMQDLETSLELFLEQNHDPLTDPDIFGSILDEQSLVDLTFVRIIRDNDQLLFSHSGDDLSFHDLARLDPHSHGCWIVFPEQQHEPYSTVWNVVSRSLDSGTIIQAGNEDINAYRMYRRLVKMFWFAVFPALGIAFLIAFLGLKLSLAPLRLLNKKLEKMRSRDVGEQELEALSSTVPAEYRRLCHHLGSIVTRNRQLVKEMQHSLDNVAHDLRTPMTRLRSVAEYGLQGGKDVEKLQVSLSDCLEEADRVLAMLKIMMSVAEAETGMMKLEYSYLDIGKSLSDIVDLYEYSAEDSAVSVSFTAPEKVLISADRTRLAQVWANLLDNAIKYNKKGGSVDISVMVEKEQVSVLFRDTGIGISELEVGRIWERLYRGDRSRSKQGLGLGLNYVKAVIEAHDGKIRVESGLNQGAVFTITLPRENSDGN